MATQLKEYAGGKYVNLQASGPTVGGFISAEHYDGIQARFEQLGYREQALLKALSHTSPHEVYPSGVVMNSKFVSALDANPGAARNLKASGFDPDTLSEDTKRIVRDIDAGGPGRNGKVFDVMGRPVSQNHFNLNTGELTDPTARQFFGMPPLANDGASQGGLQAVISRPAAPSPAGPGGR